MERGNHKSDIVKTPGLLKEELLSVLQKRIDTILTIQSKLMVEGSEERSADMENHINNIVQKHLLNLVDEIKLSIQKIKSL